MGKTLAYAQCVHRAVLFDFGGVILSSPFDAFNDYESAHGLPRNFIRLDNSTNPLENSWAKLERSDISPAEFDENFAAESAALGHRLPGREVLSLLHGEIRPVMVEALETLKAAGYIIACLTNNVLSTNTSTPSEREVALRTVLNRFDAIIESSKIGVRKPEPKFYEIACAAISVDPSECVFLDDLGVNLKPAAAMGMATIKVNSAQQALDELSHILSLDSIRPS